MKNKHVIALLLITCTLALLIPLLFFSFEVGSNTSLWGRILDAGHAPLFFIVAVLFSAVARILDWWSPRIRFYLVFLLMAMFAAICEVVQPYFNRSAGLDDWINGAIGGLTGAWGFFLFETGTTLKSRMLYGGTCLISAAFLTYPIYSAWQALLWRAESFPYLASFERPVEIFLWSGQLVRGKSASAIFQRVNQFATDGEYALEVTSSPKRYSGVQFDAGDANWEKFTSLEFDIYNPGSPFELTIRIDDNGDVMEYENRFNKNLPVASGYNSFLLPIEEIRRGPKTRKLEVGAIRRLMFFVGENTPTTVWYLDNLRLE